MIVYCEERWNVNMCSFEVRMMISHVIVDVNVLIYDHLMYQVVRPGLNLQPDEDTPHEDQDDFHLPFV